MYQSLQKRVIKSSLFTCGHRSINSLESSFLGDKRTMPSKKGTSFGTSYLLTRLYQLRLRVCATSTHGVCATSSHSVCATSIHAVLPFNCWVKHFSPRVCRVAHTAEKVCLLPLNCWVYHFSLRVCTE